jgi:hypothetical protein
MRGGALGGALVTALGIAALSLWPTAGVGADACNTPIAYPGDDASRTDIAQWMAHGARARGIPGELPVMAALVESGLRNVPGGDADSVGFFQMRVSIWDNGRYAGFPDQPELQLTWFVDHALAVRTARIAAGDADFGKDPGKWGEWIADVERAAEEFRGRYQLRLDEARALVGPACSDVPAPTATADGFAALQEWPLTVAAPGLLANDTSSAADLSVELVAGPSHGSLVLPADGRFTYQGAEDFVGTDSFTYRVSDGTQASGPATVTLTVGAACDGHPATIVGTARNDALVGSPGPDVVVGLGGKDALLGAGGNDRLCGGSGADLLSGGPGDDSLRGGSGILDVCLGGPGLNSAAGCEIIRER